MDFTLIKTGTSVGVKLEEYKGSISLVTGYEDKDGKLQLEWVRGKHWDKEARKKVENDKDSPLKIYLGSQSRAIEVLKTLLAQLTELPVFIGEQASKEDVPF